MGQRDNFVSIIPRVKKWAPNLPFEFLLSRHPIVFHLEISPRSVFHPIYLKNDPSKNREEGGIKIGEVGRKDFKVPASDFRLTVFYLKMHCNFRVGCKVGLRTERELFWWDWENAVFPKQVPTGTYVYMQRLKENASPALNRIWKPRYEDACRCGDTAPQTVNLVIHRGHRSASSSGRFTPS
jgi:hypothetical protein